MYRTPQEQQQAARAKVETYRNAAALFPKLSKAFMAFDGKCINKRLETLLRDETGRRLIVKRRYRYIDVYIYEYGASIITLARLEINEEDQRPRLDAEKAIQSAREKREELLRRAYAIEQAAKTAPQLREYIKQEAERLEKLVKDIPYEAKDIFNLSLRITF